MKPAVSFSVAFGAIATAALFLVGVGQQRKDAEDLADLRAVTIARGVGLVASAELAEVRAFADAPPPPEGQPAPEPPVEGAKTGQFLEALTKAPGGLGVKDGCVLQGTQYWAHSDPARVKKRLDRESVEDKALYDRAQKLKSAVSKNAEERERNAGAKKDAFAEVELTRAGLTQRVSVPVKTGEQFEGIAEVTLALPPPPFGLPFGVLWLGLGGLAAFVLAGAVLKEKMAGTASHVAVGVALAALVVGEAMTLAKWRDDVRTRSAEVLAEVHGELAAKGMFAESRRTLDAAPVLARNLMNEPSTVLAILPEGRSATTAASLSAANLPVKKGGATTYFSRDRLEAERALDRKHVLEWAAGIGVLALLGFGLGILGMLARARAAAEEHSTAYLYMAPAALGLLVLVFVPVAFGLAFGFFKRTYNVWEFSGLENYFTILGDFDLANPINFYFKLAITVMWTAVNVTSHVTIGLGLALLLNDQILKARGIYRVLLIVPWAVPNYITALIWKGMFHKQFGAVNFLLDALGFQPVSWFQTFWPAFATNVMTNIWLGFPFMMVISLGALQSIPGDLYEAARVDGASRFQRFRNITLPLLMPALVPSVIVGTVWTFNMFNIIYLVSGGAPNGATDILITDAFRWAFERDQPGYAAAYSTLIFVILLLFSLATNKITGATKGVFE